jgi:cytochrome c553
VGLIAAGALLSSFADASAASLQEQIALCVACHGATGQSENPEVPHIGGQPKLFVMYQLFFYREGRRKSPEMNTVAKDMSDADLTAISDYVAGLPPPPPASGAVDEARYGRGAELASKRICGTCHNPDYSGREQMPRVAGQREAYLMKSFKDYQAGVRVGTQRRWRRRCAGFCDADLADSLLWPFLGLLPAVRPKAPAARITDSGNTTAMRSRQARAQAATSIAGRRGRWGREQVQVFWSHSWLATMAKAHQRGDQRKPGRSLVGGSAYTAIKASSGTVDSNASGETGAAFVDQRDRAPRADAEHPFGPHIGAVGEQQARQEQEGGEEREP